MPDEGKRDTGVSLREYIERLISEFEKRVKMFEGEVASIKEIINERDRLYDTRFKAAETAVSAALAAQEKSTSTAFQASEKAVLKAEDAQKDYNQRSNEFRGQLDDQAKTLMPRNEAQAMFKSFEEKLEVLKSTHERDQALARTDIGNLRESRSVTVGETTTMREVKGDSQWRTGTIIVVAVAVIEILLRFLPVAPHP